MMNFEFQSTHSRGVRHQVCGMRQQRHYFNPRTHEECDVNIKWQDGVIPISIHALTRSATILLRLIDSVLINFNPRTHEECDIKTIFSSLSSADFNPRTHEECDLKSCVSSSTRPRFQSTHSRGVRHNNRPNRNIWSRFQSTHSRGVRLDTGALVGEIRSISIHALTRSATRT